MRIVFRVIQMIKGYPISDWYECDPNAIEKLKALNQGEMIVFHGDWCPDCTYTIPLLNKILKVLDNKNIKVREVDTDFNKKDKEGLAQKYKIRRVPTIVLEIGGKEVAGVTEYPNVTIEQDFAAKI